MLVQTFDLPTVHVDICIATKSSFAGQVLPMPYAQLLKIFSIFFVFTLPFVVAPHIGMWTPIFAFFSGLDQVGSELESPFGLDHNDFPMLQMGLLLCNDLIRLEPLVHHPNIMNW